MRYIDINDSEDILRAIRLTPDDMPIDMIVHTPGGLALSTEQIAMAMKRHDAKVTIFVPHYAMSGGTLLCLVAHEVVMDENAVLGPIDPQLGEYPAGSILRMIKEKDPKDIEDKTLILADVARMATGQMKEFAKKIMIPRIEPETAERIASTLVEGHWTHDYPITCEEAKDMGLPRQGRASRRNLRTHGPLPADHAAKAFRTVHTGSLQEVGGNEAAISIFTQVEKFRRRYGKKYSRGCGWIKSVRQSR